MAKTLPKEILVYECDEVDGEPVYAAARDVSEIPEEYDGVKVGVYVLNTTNVFGIRRELKGRR